MITVLPGFNVFSICKVYLELSSLGSFIKTYGISNGQLNRLRKNLYISTHTVETLCRILDCRVEDVMEIVFDENEEPLWSPGLEEERQKEKELERKKNRQG